MRALLLLATGLALLAGLGWWMALAAGEPVLLALPGGEAWGHAWVQWWHAQALPAWPGGTALARGTEVWPVIDPLPTLFAAVLARIGSVELGYNTWMLCSVALAALGGGVLARRLGGEPVVGALVLGLSPALAGSLASGLTEDGAVGLAALALALVGRRSWRDAALAGLALGLLCLCGLVLAWYAALGAVLLGAVAAVKERAVPQLALSATLAAAGAGVAAWPLRDRLGGTGHRTGQVIEAAEPLWRLNPWRGVDLLSLVAPGRQDLGDALVRVHPGYLGLGVLALALAAGRSRWWLVFGAAVLVAPGPRLALGGAPLGVANPVVAAVQWVPGGDLLNHHGRALLLASIALAALASLGAARLRRWATSRPGATPALGPLVRRVAVTAICVDLLFLAPFSLPLPTTPSAPVSVADHLDTLPPGALLDVPVAGPGVHFQRPLLDQRAHGRRLLTSPNRPGLPRALEGSDLGRWLGALAFDAPAPQGPSALPGVSVLLVREPYVDRVAAVVGAPDVRGVDSAAWDATGW